MYPSCARSLAILTVVSLATVGGLGGPTVDANEPDDVSPEGNSWYFKDYDPPNSFGNYFEDRLVVKDVDDDGRAEIFLGYNTGNTGYGTQGGLYLGVVEALAGPGTYPVVGLAPMAVSAALLNLLVEDVTLDGFGDIIAGTFNYLSSYKVRIHDASDLEALAEVDSASVFPQVYVMKYARPTPADDPWLFVGDLAVTEVLSTPSLTVLDRLQYGAGSFEVGNVEGGDHVEIVYSSGEVVYYDGSTVELRYDFEWDTEYAMLQLIDLDDDVQLEIVYGTVSGPVQAFDFGDQTPIHTWPTLAYPIGQGDIIGDDEVELVLIGQDSSVNLVSPSTKQILWTYTNPAGTGNVDFGDTDGDGEMEMVLGSGNIKVIDVATKTVEWGSELTAIGNFGEVAISNLDNAGNLEIVFSSEEGVASGQNGGYLFVLDANTHQEYLRTQVFLDSGDKMDTIGDVEIADLDGDGFPEIAVLGFDVGIQESHIVVYDGQSFAKENELFVSTCGPWKSLRIVDVDNDMDMEFVAGGPESTCGEPGDRVLVLDAATGAVEWESAAYNGAIEEIVVGQFDTDAALEIAVLEYESGTGSGNEDYVHVIDSAAYTTQWTSDGGNYHALAVFDLDQDGGPEELILGDYQGGIIIFEDDPLTDDLLERFRYYLYGSWTTGISPYTLPTGEVRLAAVNYDRLIGTDPADGSILWQTRPLKLDGWTEDNLATAQISTDTGTMFLVGGPATVHQFGGVVEVGQPVLESATYSVDEDDGSVTVTALRLGSSSGTVEIDYATEDRTAVDGVDYSGVSGSFIWANGDTSPKSVVIPILEDGDPETAEEFVFNLFNVVGGIQGRPSQARITIIDNDSSVVAFEEPTVEIDETQSPVALQVSRTGDTSFAASVGWATADGTAIAGEDYIAASGVLNWAAGDANPKTIEVTIVDDDLYEIEESFTVELSGPGGNAVVGEQSTATVTIDSEDVIEIAFSAETYTATEGDGQATITAWRTGAVNGEVSVDFATSDGTAVAGSDYTATAGTLTWTDGDSLPKTFQIPLLEDGAIELDETVMLSLANPTGGATIGLIGNATLTIEDNDGSLLQFTVASFTVDEDGGIAEFTVERFGGDSSGTVGIEASTAEGTATAGLDYLPTTTSLSWADGETDDKIFAVAILNDSQLEVAETFEVLLSNPSGNGAVGSPAIAEVTIIDDDRVEIPINTEINGPQTTPDVAMDGAGRAVVVWESYLQDGSGWGIYGQRFNPDGSAAGGEFPVNNVTSGDQRRPAVAIAADGSFTVVWRGSDGAGDGIRGRRFSAAGAPLAGEITINATTAGDQDAPEIAVDGNGAVMVVWHSDAPGQLDIRGQLYDAAGVPIGGEIGVNTTTANDQQLPAVAGSPGGGFVVAWQSYGQDGPAEGIICRRFASNGTPLSAERLVNQWTSGDQIAPAVTQGADGGFVVTWEDTTNRDGSGSSIQARRFDSGASPLGGDVQINSYWSDDQVQPNISSTGGGNLMIVWESMGQDGSGLGIFGRAFDADMQSIGGELQINTYSQGNQYRSSVSRSDSGTFWAVWASGAQDGSGDGVFGLFAEAPVDLEIFSDDFEAGNTSAWSLTSP